MFFQAAICLCNLAYHGFIKQLLQHNAIEPFINILKSANPDIISFGLQFMDMAFRNFPESKNIFEQAEGVACLEALEYNYNAHIAERANAILDTYFMEDEDEEGAEQQSVQCLDDDKMFTS